MNPSRPIMRALGCAVLMLTAIATACTPEQAQLVAAKLQQQNAVLASHHSRGALTDAQLARLAKCESGGNPTIVSRSGRYHGLYQFSQSTWNGVASAVLPDYVGVSPSVAPAHVQDAMARALFAARGRAPWPHCGRRL